MSELRECPFCGKPGEMHRQDMAGVCDREAEFRYSPGCETRYCPGEWGGLLHPTIDSAEKFWNTRATDATKAAILDTLDKWDGDGQSLQLAGRIRRVVNGVKI